MRLPLILACILIVLVCTLVWRVSAHRQFTVDELAEFIGKTEGDVRSRFGTPTREGITDYCLLDPEASATEIEKFWEQTPVRVLRYGNVDVSVNIHGRIASVHHEP